MKIKEKILIMVFTLSNTMVAIYLNWPKFLKGNTATSFNLFVSSLYLLLWFLFSLYWGFKRQGTYKKFIGIYWGLNFVSFILLAYTTDVSALAPLIIWFGAANYGFSYLFPAISKMAAMTAAWGLIISYLGYWIGESIVNIKKVI